jgi:hypothetical protein
MNARDELSDGKEIVMKTGTLGLTMLLIMVAVIGSVNAEETQKVPRDAAYLGAREQMADLLASEEFEKVDVSAASFDRAMDFIYMAVETYLDQAVPGLGDVESAREFGVDVLVGLNDHKIRFAGDDGVSLSGKRRLLISGEQDAKDLGELLARVAMLIDGGHGRPGINARLAAQRAPNNHWFPNTSSFSGCFQRPTQRHLLILL